MSSGDLGADLSSALEVTGSPTAAPSSGASPEPGTGSPAGDESAERRALQRASEALKKVERLSGSMNEIRTMLGSALQNGAPRAADPAPSPAPTAGQIAEFFQQGDYEGGVNTLQQAIQQAVASAKDEAVSQATEQVDTGLQRRDLAKYLLVELGLGKDNDPYTQKVNELVPQIRERFPNMDEATAKIVAGTAIGRQAAAGEMEFESLREEHLRRTAGDNSDAGGLPRDREEKQYQIRWDAPNRGLPDSFVKELKSFGMGSLLESQEDKNQEALNREALQDVVNEILEGRS